MNLRTLCFISGCAAWGAFSFHARAVQYPDSISNVTVEETQVVIPPLFEYVIAPEELPDLQSRTDYLMDHFWDPFDFKKAQTVDQNALNHAFGVYAQAMPYASPQKVEKSVKNLIKSINNNPGLSFQFAKAAEENLYGPRADVWGDDIFISFARNVVNNKKIKEGQKKHFRELLTKLERTSIGSPLPSLNVINLNGTHSVFLPSRKKLSLIEFTPSVCDESRYNNLKMDISGVVNDLIEEGKLDVYVMIVDEKKPADVFPEKWNVYSCPEAIEVLDIRTQPSFFVLDKEGNITGKNLYIDDAISLLEKISSKN